MDRIGQDRIRLQYNWRKKGRCRTEIDIGNTNCKCKINEYMIAINCRNDNDNDNDNDKWNDKWNGSSTVDRTHMER
jgi:hypothetical protein